MYCRGFGRKSKSADVGCGNADEDIVFQLCWAYILPSSDYPLSLTDAVLEEIQVFLSEYNMALEGQLSETEYIEKKFGFMNGIEKYCGDQALSRF